MVMRMAMTMVMMMVVINDAPLMVPKPTKRTTSSKCSVWKVVETLVSG